MALKSTNETDEYPYVFMISQSIAQQTVETGSDSPIYTLSIVWTYYKVLEDDSVKYQPDGQQSYYDENFYVTAVTDYSSGDATHISTLGAQVASIKKIVELETGKTLVDV